jgi:hypothetical protein
LFIYLFVCLFVYVVICLYLSTYICIYLNLFGQDIRHLYYRLVDKYMHQPPRWVLELIFQVSISLESGPFGKLNRSNRIQLCGFKK